MQHLELTHPHEHLSWGRFIKKETAYVVKSHAEYNKLLNRTIIIDSNYIMLDNSELIGIILDMIKPQSSTQYITDLRSLVKPVQLPNGYIITSDWSWCYKQILLLAQRFKDALEMLNSTDHTFQPTLKSRSGGGKPGLIELFYFLAPKGKEIHNDLNDSQVRSCETMQDYFDLFLGKSQNMYDNSKKSLEDAAILRGLPPLTPSGEINKESSYKHHNNNSNNNNNNSNNNNNNSNNNNNNITPNNNTKRYQHNNNDSNSMTPYANPYNKKLHNIQPHTPNQLYKVYPYNDNVHDMHNPMFPDNNMSNVRTNNMYDPYADENVYEYDYSEPDDYHNTSIINDTGLNPMYKVTPVWHDTVPSRTPLRVRTLRYQPCPSDPRGSDSVCS